MGQGRPQQPATAFTNPAARLGRTPRCPRGFSRARNAAVGNSRLPGPNCHEPLLWESTVAPNYLSPWFRVSPAEDPSRSPRRQVPAWMQEMRAFPVWLRRQILGREPGHRCRCLPKPRNGRSQRPLLTVPVPNRGFGGDGEPHREPASARLSPHPHVNAPLTRRLAPSHAR